MNRDCDVLSPKAQEIYNKLEPFYPPDPWKKPQWFEDGRCYKNGWYDLRKSADRKNRQDELESSVGYLMCLDATEHKKRVGNLKNFRPKMFWPQAIAVLEELLILDELDFQIETGDLLDEADECASRAKGRGGRSNKNTKKR